MDVLVDLGDLGEDEFMSTVNEEENTDRHSRLDELTRQAVEDGLYDVDAVSYCEALTDARKQKSQD